LTEKDSYGLLAEEAFRFVSFRSLCGFMKSSSPTLKMIASLLDPLRWSGDPDAHIDRIVPLDAGAHRPGDLVWCSESQAQGIEQLSHATVICGTEGATKCQQQKLSYFEVPNPRMAFLKVLTAFFADPKPVPGIAPLAVVAPSAKIGESVTIEAHCVIGEDCVIGNHTILHPGVVVHRNCTIGDHCTIGANSVIGGVGFGYEREPGGIPLLIPHVGNVVIKDYVDVGANTCIDRAALGSTIIESHVKIDNLVHVAHGCHIGEGTFLIAHAIVGGSVKIGKRAWIAPNSSIIHKVTVGDEAIVGLGAVVTRSVEAKTTVVGNPARVLTKSKET
jgi:UDP-3-O-[3-hydroxymyristoyl] glucosamine N-acyltransferase